MSNKKSNKNDNNIDEIIEKTFNQIKNIVDANTVIGTMVKLSDKLFIIPVSKISVGLISGGGCLPKSKKNNTVNAGSGTGFNIVPLGFVTITNTAFNFLPINSDNISKNLIDGIFKVYNQFVQNSAAKSDGEGYEKSNDNEK